MDKKAQFRISRKTRREILNHKEEYKGYSLSKILRILIEKEFSKNDAVKHFKKTKKDPCFTFFVPDEMYNKLRKLDNKKGFYKNIVNDFLGGKC